MYKKEEIQERLNKNNRSLDLETLNVLLKDWRIDPVYEDENGDEYFDELTIAKLNQGIILKEQGSSNNEIISIINKSVTNYITPPIPGKTNIQLQDSQKEGKLENITIDITNQTLSLLAESIAQKISKDLADRLNNGSTDCSTIDIGKLKRDNEILAKQVEQLLEENKKLVTNLNSLLQEKTKFKQVFGSFYIKQD